MTNFNQELKEILLTNAAKRCCVHGKGLSARKAEKEALEAIKSLVLEQIVGENEKPAGRLQTQYRNKLRQEQREKLR